jgi:hypothetical protein
VPVKFAVVGSREWPDPARVASFVRGVAKKYPDAVLISGGESKHKPRRGVDWVAEKVALEAGLVVVSFRPAVAIIDAGVAPTMSSYRGDEDDWPAWREAETARLREREAEYRERLERARSTYLVERHEIAFDLPDGFATSKIEPLDGRYVSWGQAAYARDVMIAEEAEQVAAFWLDRSPGTGHTVENARRLGRGVHLFEMASSGRTLATH